MDKNIKLVNETFNDKRIKNNNIMYLIIYRNDIKSANFELSDDYIPHANLNDWPQYVIDGIEKHLYDYPDINFFEIIKNDIPQTNPPFLNIKHIRLYNKNARQKRSQI